jgi:hypothetical protein
VFDVEEAFLGTQLASERLVVYLVFCSPHAGLVSVLTPFNLANNSNANQQSVSSSGHTVDMGSLGTTVIMTQDGQQFLIPVSRKLGRRMDFFPETSVVFLCQCFDLHVSFGKLKLAMMGNCKRRNSL